jgi:hypothetical protein
MSIYISQHITHNQLIKKMCYTRVYYGKKIHVMYMFSTKRNNNNLSDVAVKRMLQPTDDFFKIFCNSTVMLCV